MKKQIPDITALLFTLCIILFTSAITNAQKYTYKPMALEGAHWWVGFTDTNFPPWEPTDHYQYVVRGDTVVDKTSYKKVYCRELTDDNPHLIEYEVLAALLRDDTLNRKVYFVSQAIPYPWFCPQGEETMLYDYSLSVGDTMNTCIIHSSIAIIQSIGYEFIYGEERKIVDDGELGIEGIGTNYGVFEWGLGSKANEKGWWFTLLDYCLGTDEECGCQWVDIEEREALPAFRVFPNPLTHNVITLLPNVPITQALDVKLCDIAGRELYHQHFENLTQEVTIQIPAHLSSGASPMLLWVGNSRQVFFKQLLIKR